jgi:tetratricopeptide (TPR) repeat protein
MYDVEEYLHLALHASANRNPHASLGYLKEALALEPQNPQGVYLLAILHAELGLIERAIGGLTKALALDPKLEIARLQLGLLLIDRGRTVEAREQFSASRLSADMAMCTFADGMILAIDGQIAAAVGKMKAGLGLHTANAALRPLMQEVLVRLEKMQSAAAKPEARSEPANDGRIFMGAYGTPPAAR